MKKKYKISLFIIFILILISSGFLTYFKFFKPKTNEQPPIVEIKVTNSIDEYGYTLEDRDTELFKETFEELKKILNEEEIDKEKYIELVSKLFIIDLFTIDNKMSRYDIGGVEFVYKEAIDSFKSVIQNSIYKTVENNLDDSREQVLPIVSSVNIKEISDLAYKMPNDTTVDGTRVHISWTYEKDLGYDHEAVLILIPEDKKMSIVFYKNKN